MDQSEWDSNLEWTNLEELPVFGQEIEDLEAYIRIVFVFLRKENLYLSVSGQVERRV